VRHRRQLRLRSLVFRTIWLPQEELIAECNHLWSRIPLRRLLHGTPPHEVPSQPCNCGIHAANDLETAADYFYLYDDVHQPHLRYRAIGSVSLWGSVIEGDQGWRASRAYPRRIFLPRTDRSGRPTDVEAIVDGLSDYAVPVEIVENAAETALGNAFRRIKPNSRAQRAVRR
jgi:hypothetical protein